MSQLRVSSVTDISGAGSTYAPGHVVQVVSTAKTDTFSTAAGSTFTDITGLNVSITPKFSTSKILVNLSLSGVLYRPGLNAGAFRLMRNSTAIGIGDAVGSRSRTSIGGTRSSDDSLMTVNVMFLDSPSTTSATTYKVQLWQDTPGNPLYINRTVTDGDYAAAQRSISTITLMEIAQ